MAIDPAQAAERDLTATRHADLVPNTPLKDMQVNIHPGTRRPACSPHGATIPVAQTTSPTDSDELLDALDTDTRTWFTSLITDLDRGHDGSRRGHPRRCSATSGLPPRRRVRSATCSRRAAHELAQVVHNLGVLTQAASQKDLQIQTVVRAGDSDARRARQPGRRAAERDRAAAGDSGDHATRR